jgi:glycosyltransferase involved in cell wall biosynthesis
MWIPAHKPLLSVLIATMPERRDMFVALYNEVTRQVQALPESMWPLFEILEDPEMSYSIGRKRQLMLERSTGEHIVFIDDDDWIEPYYIEEILKAYIFMPTVDCLGIRGYITTDGQNQKEWYISKDFGGWYEKDNVYYRTPNHISPVRRIIALQGGFPDKIRGEDADYSMRILPYLTKEATIMRPLYYYRFRNK